MILCRLLEKKMNLTFVAFTWWTLKILIECYKMIVVAISICGKKASVEAYA